MYRKTPHFARFHDTAHLEGWAAAAAVAVSAAASIGSAAISASAADDAAGIAAPKLKSYTPVLAQQDQYAGIKGLTGAFQNYGGQAQQIASAENDWYQRSISALAPGTKQGIYTASKQANQFLRGDIPADVQASINRASAQSALTGGYGADSGMRGNLTARDLGLTSLDLQQRGMSQLGGVTALAKGLTPYSAGDILGTAQQYQSNYDQYNLRNADTQNQAARDAAGIQNQNAQSQYAQQVGAALAPSPVAAGFAAGAGAISSGLMSYYGRQAGAGVANPYANYAQPYAAGYGASGVSYVPGQYGYQAGPIQQLPGYG